MCFAYRLSVSRIKLSLHPSMYKVKNIVKRWESREKNRCLFIQASLVVFTVSNNFLLLSLSSSPAQNQSPVWTVCEQWNVGEKCQTQLYWLLSGNTRLWMSLLQTEGKYHSKCTRICNVRLEGHCHAIWQLYKKLGVFASIEFQN